MKLILGTVVGVVLLFAASSCSVGMVHNISLVNGLYLDEVDGLWIILKEKNRGIDVVLGPNVIEYGVVSRYVYGVLAETGGESKGYRHGKGYFVIDSSDLKIQKDMTKSEVEQLLRNVAGEGEPIVYKRVS
ncbi:MAG: hypothetical protein GXY15_04610 [Candidatus Hydrogenedentes bacterium]|nr:hypothetical protein [Candidatus Hydrogenedentota bacterium]